MQVNLHMRLHITLHIQSDQKQLPVIWNREVGGLKEVADIWEPIGKINRDLYKTGRISELPAEERWS